LAQSKLIMFDFDGVIAGSLDEQCRACVETLRARGFADLATPAQFLDFTETNWLAALADAGVPEDVVEELEEAFGAIPSPDLFPEMVAVIERLAAAHPVVVITSSRTSVVEGILAEHGVRGVVEVLGGEQEASKTRKIRSVRRRFGEPLPAWYACDTVGDVLEARAAGVGTVGVAWGWHEVERLRRVKPDRMAHAPSDLLDRFQRRRAWPGDRLAAFPILSFTPGPTKQRTTVTCPSLRP
jgi:phosphoglycolate phosphatase